MSLPLNEFSAEEIQEFEEIGYQRQRDSRLQYVLHGEPISARHKKYCDQQKKEKQDGKAAPGSSPSTSDGHPVAAGGLGEAVSPDNDHVHQRNSPLERSNQALQLHDRPHGVTIQKRLHDIQMYSTKIDDWCTVVATLDTGAEENWISKRIVDRLGLSVSNGHNMRWITFSGKELRSSSWVSSTWKIHNAGITCVTDFRVADDPPFDVLFGWNSLNCHEGRSFCKNRGAILVLVQPEEKGGEKTQQKKNQAEADADSERLYHKQGNFLAIEPAKHQSQPEKYTESQSGGSPCGKDGKSPEKGNNEH